jgi:hypothetical protein
LWISGGLGKPERVAQAREALVGAAEIGEIAAEHDERMELRQPCVDPPCDLEGVLADREGLLVPPDDV